MNTQKQIALMVVLMFVLAGGCAAYTAIDLPYRAKIKEDYQLEESIVRGALLFANNCRACHGDRGQGGVGLPLNTDAYKDQDPLTLERNRAKLRTTLYCGRLGTFMQPWLNSNGGSLNAVQIEHLIDLITDPTGKGWDEAVEFSHNLNHELSAVVSGDTLDGIAKTFRIGVPELEALNPGYGGDELLPRGARIKLPANSQFPEGRAYRVRKNNETLARIADNQRVGAAILVDLNATSIEPGKTYSYEFDVKKNTFTLLVDGQPVVGLFPGAKLALPDNLHYVVVDTDTISGITERLEIDAAELRALNPALEGIGDQEALTDLTGIVLTLPRIETYVVKGQSLADVAAGFAGLRDGAKAFAEANGVNPTDVLRIGQSLKLPLSSWGPVFSGTLNNGKACVENAVPTRLFEELTGGGPQVERPSEISTEVEILAHANDWQIVADGVEMEPNKGAVAIAPGTEVKVRNVEGVHTTTLNGKKEGDDIFTGDERTFTFNEPGDFTLTCDYHPDMFASIFVVEP